MSHLVKKYYDVSKFVIWGEGDDSNRRPRLVFSFRDGNPRITIYTGNTGPESVISFPCDAPHMAAIFTYMKDIATGPNGNKISVDSLTTVYENNQPTTQKRVIGVLHIGKTNEGIVYITVTAENRPKIIFPIKPSQYHVFRDANKNEIPATEISVKMALGIVNLGLEIISQAMMQYSNEEYASGVRKANEIKSNTTSGSSKVISKDMIQDLDDIAL